MRCICILVLVCCATTAFAGNEDSLYHLLKKNYVQQKTSREDVVEILSNAAVKTFSIRNQWVRASLKDDSKPDHDGMKKMVTDVVGHFIDHNLMDIDCPKCLAEFTPVLDAFNNLLCSCITDKAALLKSEGKSKEAFEGIETGCMMSSMSDTATGEKIKRLITDPAQVRRIAMGYSTYMYSKCPYERTNAIETCIDACMENYKSELTALRPHLREAFMDAIQTTQWEQLRHYFADAASFKKAKSQLEPIAARVVQLKAERDAFEFKDGAVDKADLLTLIYTGYMPEVICQLEVVTEIKRSDLVIRSFTVVPASQIKDKDRYLKEFSDVGILAPPIGSGTVVAPQPQIRTKGADLVRPPVDPKK